MNNGRNNSRNLEDSVEWPQNESQQKLSYLEHHGIKGMKWGVRRTPEQLGYKRTKKKFKVKFESPFKTKEERLSKKEAKLSAKEIEMARKLNIKAREDVLKAQKKYLNTDFEAEARKAEKKAQSDANKVNKKQEKEQSERERAVDVEKPRSAKSMSDEELRNFINRYNLEQQYNKIRADQTKTGRDWVTDTLKKSGQQVAQKYVTKAMEAGIEALIKKANQNRRGGSGGGGGTP